jgi:hypothetical protein
MADGHGEYLNAADVARELGLPVSAVYTLLHASPPPFPVLRTGRRYRVARADLEGYRRDGTREVAITADLIEAACERAVTRVIDPAFLKPELRMQLRLRRPA